MALTLVSTAGAVTRIPSRCTTRPAPVLCAIHFHHDRANVLRARLGLGRLGYHWMAEAYPQRRPRLLRYWRHVHAHTLKRYHAYQEAQQANPVAIGETLAAAHGWTGSEWTALYTLWNYESGWDPYAVNPSSGACSIPQFLPCRYLGDVRGSILAGIAYISDRYGAPSVALAHYYAYGWY